MTNEEKAKEIVQGVIHDRGCSDVVTDRAIYNSAMTMADWKDERIQHIIDCATINLIATLEHCKIFSDKSIVKCAEDFKNNLIKESGL